MKNVLFLSCCIFSFLSSAATSFPESFDLRNVNGKNYVSSVKNQSGGTCWTHATMAAIEGNLLLNGTWANNGESGEPNLAEYHLDWWNGFNQHNNPDVTGTSGLEVHEGGDYRVAAAYLSRGVGVVREVDGQSFSKPPELTKPSYHHYYVRDIEWMDSGTDLKNINTIKQSLMENGVVGTALAWEDHLYSGNQFYQPPSDKSEPNHAVAIIGWDDTRKTQAPKNGAWLVKNSWGIYWGTKGYFWISYYDKVSGQHPEMGAVAFKNTERMQFSKIYSHDTHGWRDTKANVQDAFNAFAATGSQNGKREVLKAVSFYTTADNVRFLVSIYKKFENGELGELVSLKDGTISQRGFHTVDLDSKIYLGNQEKFYVKVSLSQGGHAFDRTSDVPVLLGSKSRVIVPSKASPGESFYQNQSHWIDLTKDDSSANFCIKALTVVE